MKKNLLYFLLFVCTFSNAQSPNWLWGKSPKVFGTVLDEGFAVATDLQGNVYVTGQHYSSPMIFGIDTLSNLGLGDIFLAKYNSAGNVLWAKSFGGNYDDAGLAITVDPLGNVILAGNFKSIYITFGTYLLGPNLGNGGRIFVTKLNSSGNVIWSKFVSGNVDDAVYSVNTDHAGNIYLAGSFSSSTINFGTFTLNNAGGFDMFLAKYDSAGNVIWAKDAGGASNDEAYAISSDTSGNVYVAGWFNSASLVIGSFTLNGYGVSVWLAKYDVNGNVVWAQTATGFNYGWIYSICTDPSGNIYLTGEFRISPMVLGSFTLPLIGYGDVFIAKYNPSGNVIWAESESAGPTDYCRGYSMSIDQFNNIYVTGSMGASPMQFGSVTITPPPPPAQCVTSCIPLFIVKLDQAGTALCGSALQDGVDDNVGVSADHFGNAYVVADFQSDTMKIGPDTLLRSGIEDIYLAKFTCNGTNLVKNISVDNAGITIFPNPSSGIFQLTIKDEIFAKEKVELKIYNYLGELILTTNILSSITQVDLNDKGKGIYFFQISSVSHFISSGKIIIE